jgi:hypothetical protein
MKKCELKLEVKAKSIKPNACLEIENARKHFTGDTST